MLLPHYMESVNSHLLTFLLSEFPTLSNQRKQFSLRLYATLCAYT